jgi:hypothetical protein
MKSGQTKNEKIAPTQVRQLCAGDPSRPTRRPNQPRRGTMNRRKIERKKAQIVNRMAARSLALATLLIVLGITAFSGAASAATRYVGTCETGSYPSIQAAVNASSSGDSVEVCPGTYSELVVIKGVNLTLEGILNGSGYATLVYPAADVQCALGSYCAQILVENATVTVSQLALDGLDFHEQCRFPAGIEFENSSGTISSNIITNHISECPGEQGGPIGFFGEAITALYPVQGTYNLNISSNTISAFGDNGIEVIGQKTLSEGPQVNLFGAISQNTITETGVLNYGIFLEGRNFVVKENTISSSINPSNNIGIYLSGGNHITALLNTINGPLFGIYAPGVDSSTISFNKVSNSAYTGVDLQCGTGNSIGFNDLTGTGSSATAGVLLSVCGPPEVQADHNTVVSNSISNYCSGVLEDPSDTDNNIVFNSFHDIGPGTNIMVAKSCP